MGLETAEHEVLARAGNIQNILVTRTAFDVLVSLYRFDRSPRDWWGYDLRPPAGGAIRLPFNPVPRNNLLNPTSRQPVERHSRSR